MTDREQLQWIAVDPQPTDNCQLSPAGTIWVCAACGKKTVDRINGPHGWDASCYLNAVLCINRPARKDQP